MGTRGLERLEGPFGVRASGVDLSVSLDDDSIRWIEQALSDHAIVLFPDQGLNGPQLDRFARRFGSPQRHVLERYRHPEVPEVSYVTNVNADGSVDEFGVRRASMWHTDATYEAHLPRLAMLHALKVPTRGGGTLFSDMRSAWDGLDRDMAKRLSGLTGLHRFNAGPDGGRSIYAGQPGTEEGFVDQHHPARLRDPLSLRSILFVNPAHTHGFAGVEVEEGWRLVETLAAHATQTEFVYHHHWRRGDVLIWDERATMHRSAGDSEPNEPRVLMRSIVFPTQSETAAIS